MAYQQQGGLTNGPVGSGDHHGPQGTEYTLQGEHLKAHTGRVGGAKGAALSYEYDGLTLGRCYAIPPDRMAQP